MVNAVQVRGWIQRPLGEILRVRHGRSQHDIESPWGRYPILGTSGEIGKTDSYIYDRPSVLIGRKGTIDVPRYVDIPFWTIDTLFYTEISEVIIPKYLFYVFNTIDWRSYNEASGVPSLSAHIIEKISICYPLNLDEQEKIVSALTDIDASISSLNALIEKKRNIKTATMQALLSGRTRLPGNRTAWQTVRMGDLGTPYGGLSGVSSTDFSSDGASRYIPFMNVMTDVSIDKSWVEPVRVEHPESQTAVQVNDLLFNGSSETPGEVGLCSVLTEDIGTVYLNSFCFGFRLHSPAEISSLFLAYWFRGALGRKVMSALAQGAIRYNLAKSALKKVELTIPGRPEQDAIVDVLHAMSQEISALMAQRGKLVAMRTGTAHSLLTGNIRLV